MGDNLDISNLLLQLAAQTEVHEKYTQAFVKIIEALDEIKQKIVIAQGADGEYFRYLLEKSVSLSEQLKSFVEVSTNAQRDLERDIETYNVIANKFIDQMSIQNEAIKELTPAILRLSNRLEENQTFLKKAVDDVADLTTEVEGLIKANEVLTKVMDEEIDKMGHVADLTEHMAGQVATLHEAHSGAKSAGRHIKMYFLALGVFIAVVESLVQLGILHLTWGSH